jgi:hypothetical protein
MFTKEAFKAKSYNLKSIIDGMLTAVDSDVISTEQAVGVINASVSKMNDENDKAKGGA